MIVTEFECRAARGALARLQAALATAADPAREPDPAVRAALGQHLRAQAADLAAELADYEALRAGRVSEVVAATLAELPAALVKARLLAGLSQRELAERLGVSEQVVQRDEASRYARARVDRLLAAAAALGVRLVEPVRLTAEPPCLEDLRAAVATPPRARAASGRTMIDRDQMRADWERALQ